MFSQEVGRAVSMIKEKPPKRLLKATEVGQVFGIDEAALQRLVLTGQLIELRICGEVRYDSDDIAELISTYKRVQRKAMVRE
jgi:hypothetical protein